MIWPKRHVISLTTRRHGGFGGTPPSKSCAGKAGTTLEDIFLDLVAEQSSVP